MSEDNSQKPLIMPFASAVTSPTSADLVFVRKVHPVIADLPDTYCIGIGRIIAHWSYQEWLLQQIINKLLKIGPKQGRIAIGSPRSKDCMKRIFQLVKAENIHVQTNLNDLSEKLKNAERQRDLVGHGIWLQDANTGKIHIQDIAGKLQPPGQRKGISKRIVPKSEPIDESKLSKYTEDIKATIALTRQLEAEIDAFRP